MLDLQPRIGFNEHERQLAGRHVDEKLKRSQTLVSHFAGHAQRGLRERGAQGGRERGAGRDLDELLEAPLQRALALAQAHHLPAVAQQLQLDMARIAHQPLDIDAVDAKRGQRFAAAARIGRGQFLGAAHGAHAAPAAAAQRLDHHAGAALRRKERLCLRERHRALAARHQRHAAALGQSARAGLVAEQRQLRGRGADEAQAGSGAGLGEVGALAQKAIAGVDGVAAQFARDRQQPRAVEVGRRPRGRQRPGLVGGVHMGRVGVVGGMHGDAGNAQVAQRAHDAQRNFAAVGDQYFVEHGGHPFRQGP